MKKTWKLLQLGVLYTGYYSATVISDIFQSKGKGKTKIFFGCLIVALSSSCSSNSSSDRSIEEKLDSMEHKVMKSCYDTTGPIDTSKRSCTKDSLQGNSTNESKTTCYAGSKTRDDIEKNNALRNGRCYGVPANKK